jgi:hypothetical protein
MEFSDAQKFAAIDCVTKKLKIKISTTENGDSSKKDSTNVARCE